MFKKLFLVIIASIFMMTACNSVKGVNFNQLFLNNAKVKSSQSYTVASLNLSYKKTMVKDKDYLKILNLLNHMKWVVETKTQNADTGSMSGFVQLQQGKIPFQLYSDKKQMVLLLDKASKAIRIPVQQDAGKNDELVQSIQSKLLPSVVKNLPNPKLINVQKNVKYKVPGENIKGYKIDAKVYASEVPGLLLKFMTNLSNDQKALQQTAAVFTQLNKISGDNTVVSTTELKQFLKQFKDDFNKSYPDLKKAGVFEKRNILKAEIWTDSKFNERKSYTEITLNKLPKDNGGLEGITLKITQDIWNINKTVKAQKINRTKYINENASEEEFLSTLDKKHSVLYRVIKSFN